MRSKPFIVSGLLVLAVSACAPTAEQVQLKALAQTVQRLEHDLAAQRASTQDLSQELLLVKAHLDEPVRTPTTPALEVFKVGPAAPPPAVMELRQEAPIEITMDSSGYLRPLTVTPVPKPKKVASNAAADELFHQALAKVREGAYDAAYDVLAALATKYPSYSDADSVLYWMGDCRFEQGRYADAVAAYQRFLGRYPAAAKVPAALLKMGLSYKRADKTAEARDVLLRLLDKYPHHAEAELARTHLQGLAVAAGSEP